MGLFQSKPRTSSLVEGDRRSIKPRARSAYVGMAVGIALAFVWIWWRGGTGLSAARATAGRMAPVRPVSATGGTSGRLGFLASASRLAGLTGQGGSADAAVVADDRLRPPARSADDDAQQRAFVSSLHEAAAAGVPGHGDREADLKVHGEWVAEQWRDGLPGVDHSRNGDYTVVRLKGASDRRSYLRFSPDSLLNLPQQGQEQSSPERDRRPALFVFHAHGQTAWSAALNDTGWSSLAVARRFHVVYLQAKEAGSPSAGTGTSSRWRARTAWDIAPTVDGQRGVNDDLLYTMLVLRNVLDDSLAPVDPNRVYVVGVGPGGDMALNAAIRFSGYVAAAASYWGGIPDQSAHHCPVWSAVRRIPVLLLTAAQSKHRAATEHAQEEFRSQGHQVVVWEQGDDVQGYRRSEEPRIWRWLADYELDISLCKLPNCQ